MPSELQIVAFLAGVAAIALLWPLAAACALRRALAGLGPGASWAVAASTVAIAALYGALLAGSWTPLQPLDLRTFDPGAAAIAAFGAALLMFAPVVSSAAGRSAPPDDEEFRIGLSGALAAAALPSAAAGILAWTVGVGRALPADGVQIALHAAVLALAGLGAAPLAAYLRAGGRPLLRFDADGVRIAPTGFFGARRGHLFLPWVRVSSLRHVAPGHVRRSPYPRRPRRLVVELSGPAEALPDVAAFDADGQPAGAEARRALIRRLAADADAAALAVDLKLCAHAWPAIRAEHLLEDMRLRGRIARP